MKLMAKVLTASLAVAVAAGMGLSAAAVGNGSDENNVTENGDLNTAPNWLSQLVKGGFPKELAKQMVMEMLQNACAKVSPETIQKVKEIAQQIKLKTERYSYQKGVLFLTEGDFRYRVHISPVKGITAEAVVYEGADTDLYVPASADGIPVTAVNITADTDDEVLCRVRTLHLSENIRELSGLHLFSMYNLEAIFIDHDNPYLMSADGVAFDKSGEKLAAVPCSQKKYIVPEGVTAIGEYAFFCGEIQELTLPQSLHTIGAYAFWSCMNLQEVKVPDGVSVIGKGAFMDCPHLQKAVIPASVTKMDDSAFDGADESFVMVCEDARSYAADYARKKGFSIEAPLAVELEASSLTFLGIPVKMSASAKGGAGSYTYAFYCKRPNETKWSTLQGFKENNTMTFNPAYEGTYEICMKVKDSDGAVEKVYHTLTVTQLFQNRSTLSADTIRTGETVTIHGAASKLLRNTTYAVYTQKSGESKWTALQHYSSNPTVEWTPARPGEYIICVKVKSSTGLISKKYLTLQVNA